ncbi:cadherin-like beta sandwich domain-containing protein [Cohnella rhizosphaerae]|uniref:Cadherin-like beta sandwich domain-containing protein n=1 Tax=Cohnella rhizosphaerae TaxID=1457232 RepID=A0A9X4KWR9_9BACL|nr:cadherin-like beta sandwich domain-containing protein [Cohnella rhizosphaerae]MDG0811771.1 cadherin-like beta sandwich domain-containing protein [Cohnella rhizosphaerae]
MKRKWGLTLLAALLVLLPVSTAFGGKASAASSSRIAVIKQLSGDVQVQKSGGSKQFKAFAKLSLNQGDKLITGSKGSAVLQFANGTSEDDKFTVGENATLTFSKLSDKKGTVTKVSMLKGTAWVDVKSIKSKDDDFKLETPTAIMGVRGTAFFARVNPATGGTSTAVLSGVVRFTSEHVEKTGSGSGESAGGTGSSGSSKTIDLYPTQQITLEPTSGDDLREQTTLVDIEEIVKNASPEVIEAILRSKEKIDEENRQTVEKFKQAGVPAELQQGLDKFIQNTQELLGVIAKQAIDQKKIEERQVKQIEEQEKTSFNLTKDQLSQLDEKEKAKQEKARQLAEEAAKKKAAEEAAKLKELADKINAAALKAIEAAKQAQAEANRLAAEAAKRKAEEELLKKLNEQQKQQYQQDKTNNQGGTSVTPGTNPGNPSSNANLGSLSIAGAALSPSFNAAVADYRASVASDKASVVVGASVQESGATFTINGQSPSGGQRTVSLAYGDNEIAVLVTAPSGATKTYKVTVTRQLLNSVSVVFPGQTGIDIDFNSTNAPAPLSIPSGSSNLTLVVPVTGPELDIAVNGQAVQPEPMFTAALTILANQISWRYNIPLALDSNRIVIRATIDDAVKSYELIANRAMSSETAVQSIEATSADGNTVYEAVAGYDVWTVSVPTETSAIKLKINTINADAKVVLGGNVYASGAQISYLIINTTVPFVVQAADGRTEREYRIAIERGTGGGILIANSASVTTAYQTPYSGVLTSSVGAGVTYEVLGEGGPENGTLDVNEDGSYTYTPDEGFEGMDYFLFRAVRGESASAPAVVTIHVEPYDYETPGLVSWTSTWGDAAVEDWFFDYSYQDEEGVGKDYWLYRDRPVNLRMDFTFDPLLVTDAVLALGEQNVYQAADGALQADLEIEEGMNYVSLQYSAEVSGEIKQFNLNFDVYVGTPEDSEIYAYLSTEGMAEVDLVPAGEQTWTTAVRDGDELLLLKYFNDRTTVEVTANGEEVGLDYYYYIYLNRGWNEIVVRTYYPGGEAEAVVKKIHVWRGSEAPEGYGLTGISGTPVKAEPEASPAPIGFIADESRSNLWKAVVTEDTASIDIKPGLGNGLALTDFYVDDYGAYVPAEETAPGSGRYHVPIDGEYTAAYAIVKPVGGGTPFPYRLEIASGAPMDLGPVLASYTGGASETPAMLLFADAAGAWWARLGTDAEPHGFKLKVGGSPGYQLFVDGGARARRLSVVSVRIRLRV